MTVDQLERELAEAQKQWQAALGELQLQMTKATFDTWLRGSRVIECDDSSVTIHVRHTYAVDWLQNRLLPVITQTMRRHTGREVTITFTARAPESEENWRLVPEAVPDEKPKPRRGSTRTTQGRASENLNPRYRFETFVVGTGNRLAHAAAKAVAENPAHAYNPLFIYGGVGLGKTHLLHAIGKEIQERGLQVLYVSSEWFTNDLINAIRSRKTKKFRGKYRLADVLLIDDIQFIAGKERTQEEFFHTFNTLHSTGKQIVMTCDRPPKALVALEDRLLSRFNWGLIADVKPPDYETRVAILRTKAEKFAIGTPDDVLTYIARKVPSNIRELEGALNRVVAHAQLIKVPMNLSMARNVLESIIAPLSDLTPEAVLETVARHYDLTEEQLTGRSRARAVSLPRQLCMYVIREEMGTSLPQIGKLLGGRDHTTVLHGCEKIASKIETDEVLRRDWLTIKEMLSESVRI